MKKALHVTKCEVRNLVFGTDVVGAIDERKRNKNKKRKNKINEN